MCNTLSNCVGNAAYDILTICISIADVTTDIVVLIDFYNKERMGFFGISLTILILAQCSYAMAFAVRFNTIDSWDFIKALCCFCCMLPCGFFVAFVMYFADEDTQCDCVVNCLDNHHLRTNSPHFVKVKSTDSALSKWIKHKLSKHMGFILEAGIEAFPQSLLQIIAIVYYQEANYVSIASILISMFSVMSKSLVLSQGVEILTFVWTWLCIVTDFFGIFFTLTWVFYSDDSIDGNFLGYFSIFGQIWIFKILFGVLAPVCIGLICWFGFGLWILMIATQIKNSSWDSRCGWFIVLIIFGNLAVVLVAFVAAIALEVFCFSLIALAVYAFSTSRIIGYSNETTSKTVKAMLNFISAGTTHKHDRIIRILSINYALNEYKPSRSKKLCDYIDSILVIDHEYKAIESISYSNIREHCKYPRIANIYPVLWDEIIAFYVDAKTDYSTDIGFEKLADVIAIFIYFVFGWCFTPIIILTKLVQISFPWIIIGYLLANNLLFNNKVNTFQLVMLGIYASLQIILFICGMVVLRIHFWLFHIQPGVSTFLLPESKFIKINDFYERVTWPPKIERIVKNYFGEDIGNIVLFYLKQLNKNY